MAIASAAAAFRTEARAPGDPLGHRVGCQFRRIVEPMDCAAVSKLPDGSQWLFEIRLGGYGVHGLLFGVTVAYQTQTLALLDKPCCRA